MTAAAAAPRSPGPRGAAGGLRPGSEARGRATDLIRILVARLGRVSTEVREIILAQVKSAPETLDTWFGEAIQATDANAAQALLRKISAG